MMDTKFIGTKNDFAIEYTFYNEARETEISMYVKGQNILAFKRNGKALTTHWQLDELANWLRGLIDNLKEDPYPVDCVGEFAAIKDENAREFDPDDDSVFDAYYQKLYEWNQRHNWHHASSGAILANVYFQQVGDNVEVSWNNKYAEKGVIFASEKGGSLIPKELFVSTVNAFLRDYALQWF